MALTLPDTSAWLAEDVGTGDVTTLALFDERTTCKAVVLAKEPGVVCGLEAATAVYAELGVAFDPLVEEGTPVEGGSIADVEGLARGVLTGERLALNLARQRISRLASPRKDFGFGGMISGYDNEGPGFVEPFKRAFNQATIGWYWWGPEEPPETRINYQRMDASTQWCLDNGIRPKGFGYC